MMQLSVRNFNEGMIFHLSSNCKATESALMRDEKVMKAQSMISSQARYVSGICKTIANTKIKRKHNQKQHNKPLTQSQSHEQNSQKNDTFRKESLHSKCEHQKHNFFA